MMPDSFETDAATPEGPAARRAGTGLPVGLPKPSNERRREPAGSVFSGSPGRDAALPDIPPDPRSEYTAVICPPTEDCVHQEETLVRQWLCAHSVSG